jgi:hypothetical protein
MKATFAAAWLLAAAAGASADTIRLKNGGALEGVVIREAEGSVVVRLKYATVTLDRADIEAIEKKAAPAEPAAEAGLRLAKWDACIGKLAGRAWFAEMRQVPATVIEKGVLKHVPYMSHKSGDYEFNLYGDPDRPACLEVGVYRDLLKSEAAKKNCLELMAALLPDARDAGFLSTLDLKQDRKEREGLTFEVTPETAEDAYGGWWVTVYDAGAVEAARATEEELKEITMAEEELEDEEPKPKVEPRKPEPRKPAAQPRPVQETIYVFKRPEMKHARPAVKGGKGRRIFVRGIHRPRGGVYRPGIPRGGIRR